jgi:hypothetical protein
MFTQANSSACSPLSPSSLSNPATPSRPPMARQGSDGKPSHHGLPFLGPIPVPAPKSIPSKFSSAVVSETIPLTGWGSIEDVKLSKPKDPSLPATTAPFSPSAIGFSGLVHDEYQRLSPSLRSQVSLPEFEFYHYVLWWFRVYHSYSQSPLRGHEPSIVDTLPLSEFEHLAFPLPPSVRQHLSCIGHFEHDGKTHNMLPPLLTSDPTNLFGLRDLKGCSRDEDRSFSFFEWMTAPVLLKQFIRVSQSLYPNDDPIHPDLVSTHFDLVHTSLIDTPGCYCDSRHSSHFSSALQSVLNDPSPWALLRASPSDLLKLCTNIGSRLSSAYASVFLGSLPSAGSPLQLTFNTHLRYTNSGSARWPDELQWSHDRSFPSSPEFGFVPPDIHTLTAAIRMDFSPLLPESLYQSIDSWSGCKVVSRGFDDFWSRFHGQKPIPLNPGFFRARKFLVPVTLGGIPTPTDGPNP